MDKSVLYSLLENYINNTNKTLIIRDIKVLLLIEIYVFY